MVVTTYYNATIRVYVVVAALGGREVGVICHVVKSCINETHCIQTANC